MLTAAGETFEGGDTTRCPGEASCDDWQQPFDGDEEMKEQAICFGCSKFPTKPSRANFSTGPTAEEIDDLVNDIESIIDFEDAGLATDWSEYPIEYAQLAVIWRNAEKEISEIRSRYLHTLVKSFMK